MTATWLVFGEGRKEGGKGEREGGRKGGREGREGGSRVHTCVSSSVRLSLGHIS